MYGKHEQEMALNVNNFREWILALPPSLTADALTSALKAWTTLMANAGLSKQERPNVLNQLAKLLNQVGDYFLKGSESMPPTELQSFLDGSLDYSERLTLNLKALAALSRASMNIDQLCQAEDDLIKEMELLEVLFRVRVREMRRSGRVKAQTTPTPALLQRPALRSCQSTGPSQPSHSERNGTIKSGAQTVCVGDPVPSGIYVPGPLHEDPPAYVDRKTYASMQARGQVDESREHRPQHRHQPAPLPIVSADSDCDSVTSHRSQTGPITNRAEDQYTRSSGRDRRGETTPAASRRPGGKQQYACSSARDGRTTAAPVVRRDDQDYARCGGRDQHAANTRPMGDGRVLGSRPREIHGAYPTNGRGSPRQDEVERLGHRLQATRLTSSSSYQPGMGGFVNIGSGNISGNNMRNVGNTSTTYGPPSRSYDDDYVDGYHGYYSDEAAHQRGAWQRDPRGRSRGFN